MWSQSVGGNAGEWRWFVGERSIGLGCERKLRGRDSMRGRDNVRVVE